MTPDLGQPVEGQINLRDAVNGTIEFQLPGKAYRLKPDPRR